MSKRISTVTYEPGREEPVLGLRPACAQFRVPKDSEDFALLPGERLLLARAGLAMDAPGRLELRSLEVWEPAPYAVLPLRPPIVVDDYGELALVQVELVEGWEASLAVVDLDDFDVIAHLPFTAPFAFVPDDAPVLYDAYGARASVNPTGPPPPRSTLPPGPRSTHPPERHSAPPLALEPGSALAVREEPDVEVLPPERPSIAPPPGPASSARPPGPASSAGVQGALTLPEAPARRGFVATLPYAEANDRLIRMQPSDADLRGRFDPTGEALRCTAVVDLDRNVLCRVARSTGPARQVVVPDMDSQLTITDGNVFVRRTSLGDGAIDWDVAIGRNQRGSIFSCYAASFAETELGRLLAAGVYDQRVVLIDIDKGEEVAHLDLHAESRARIDALAWNGGRLLAIGLANGTVMLCWPPARLHGAWRVRVWQGAPKGIRALHFHDDGDKLFLLSKDGCVRAWPLLDDERVEP